MRSTKLVTKLWKRFSAGDRSDRRIKMPKIRFGVCRVWDFSGLWNVQGVQRFRISGRIGLIVFRYLGFARLVLGLGFIGGSAERKHEPGRDPVGGIRMVLRGVGASLKNTSFLGFLRYMYMV